MRKKILVIDDDLELNSLLKDYLAQHEFDVLTAAHPKEGMDLLKLHKPDLVVLDVMLPDKSGFEVCREIRSSKIQTPIIMLSAKSETDNKITGLDMGADDYMPKPYEPRELVARIQSVLRRSEGRGNLTEVKVLKSNNLIVDIDRATVTHNNEPLDLTTMEFEILCLFMQNPGVTLSREQVVDKIRGIEWDSVDRTIDVLISRLRHKLKDDAKNPKYLKTIWGSGYRFVGEVTNN